MTPQKMSLPKPCVTRLGKDLILQICHLRIVQKVPKLCKKNYRLENEIRWNGRCSFCGILGPIQRLHCGAGWVG